MEYVIIVLGVAAISFGWDVARRYIAHLERLSILDVTEKALTDRLDHHENLLTEHGKKLVAFGNLLEAQRAFGPPRITRGR